MINEGQIVEGKVTAITKFGAFVKVESGEVGLVHISEVAEEYVKDINDYLTEGQVVKVKSLGSGKDGKLSLSIKRVESDKPKQEENFNFNNQQKDSKAAFEDILSKFMKESEERLHDLRKNLDNRKGYGGYSRRSSMR